MTRVKIDTSATIDGATTAWRHYRRGYASTSATTVIVATTVTVAITVTVALRVTVDTTVVDTTVIHTQCRETMLAALVDGRGIYAAYTIKTGTQATLQPPPTSYATAQSRASLQRLKATATTAGTATTNSPTATH